MTLSELAKVDPPIFKLGLVGIPRAGKTNLHDRIGNRRSADERTQMVYPSVFGTSLSKLRFVAVLDGAGNELGALLR